ncbi:hypothetical protein ADL21_37960 [Streptomyces albus subsp. albus]|nr:hypothetical protein ADL21_37960 [Streptomyces albus subsp. albus]
MADKDVLFAETSRFATTLAALPPVGQVLHELARCGASSLGMRSAGVSLFVDDRPRLAGALDEASTALGEAQERLTSSPCAEALRTARPVAVVDLTRAPGRWIAYEEVARRFGVVALASVPLCGDGRVLGAVDLYDTAARPWPSHDLSAVRLLNDIATAYLAHSTALDEWKRLADPLPGPPPSPGGKAPRGGGRVRPLPPQPLTHPGKRPHPDRRDPLPPWRGRLCDLTAQPRTRRAVRGRL